MTNGVTTQWFDLHVKAGNYLPNQKQTTLSQEQKIMKEQHEEDNKLQNKLNRMKVEDIKQQLQDDLDFDDQFTRQYMADRMKILQVKAKLQIYGKVLEISRDQYIREVTEADPKYFVMLHLYDTANQFCLLINQHLPAIALKYSHVKFIKIIATKCIENFPDKNCPCFIIYKAGKPVSNLCNVDKIMKNDINNLELLLESHGIMPL